MVLVMLFSLSLDARHMAARTVYDSLQLADRMAAEVCYRLDSQGGEKTMKKVLGLSVVLAVAPFAQAADIEAGKARAATVCAACHGANGQSVSDTLPKLAAQRPGYPQAPLKAVQDGTRQAASAAS